jgi:hypothetical protein
MWIIVLSLIFFLLLKWHLDDREKENGDRKDAGGGKPSTEEQKRRERHRGEERGHYLRWAEGGGPGRGENKRGR